MSKDLVRLSALAAILSSGLSFLTALVSMFAVFFPGFLDPAVTGLVVVTDLFIFFALVGFYGVQTKESGGLGLVGFALAVLTIPATILLPSLGFPLFLVGILLFAVANMRARVLPAGGMWLWFAGAMVAVPAAFLNLTILFALGLVVIGCGRAWLGAALWSLTEKDWGSLSGRPLVAPMEDGHARRIQSES